MCKKGFTPAPITIKQKPNTQLVREVYPRTNCKKTKAKPQLVRGLTLMEIIVATFLIVLTLTGLIHLFVAGKVLILHSHAKMAGGELGKVFLDPLQMDVRQDQWGNNCLSAGINCPGIQTVDNIPYTPTYERTLNSPINNLNKVKITITWTEPTP